jgi:hypothetical protein
VGRSGSLVVSVSVTEHVGPQEIACPLTVLLVTVPATLATVSCEV